MKTSVGLYRDTANSNCAGIHISATVLWDNSVRLKLSDCEREITLSKEAWAFLAGAVRVAQEIPIK